MDNENRFIIQVAAASTIFGGIVGDVTNVAELYSQLPEGIHLPLLCVGGLACVVWAICAYRGRLGVKLRGYAEQIRDLRTGLHRDRKRNISIDTVARWRQVDALMTKLRVPAPSIEDPPSRYDIAAWHEFSLRLEGSLACGDQAAARKLWGEMLGDAKLIRLIQTQARRLERAIRSR